MYCAGLVIQDAVFCLANFDDAFFYLCNPTSLGPQHTQTTINDLPDNLPDDQPGDNSRSDYSSIYYSGPSDSDSDNENEFIVAERGKVIFGL
jgi:hypothetical protein